ncbi:MAG TPA: DivIVA domain-containing protein [Plantibacter sp.]|uniref:DivIVA domain-containing protein n=1 Tax=unclassified Plantibacter TaxID=2624265 RepID=UPI002CA47F89|nr:DivIVA domain-containing protein [Plantibacter sp.]
MALTPEDVVQKRFQQTKFREGYDQDEVDDFLDEVVVELRRLIQEKDEVQQKLTAAEAKVAELQSGGSSAPAAPAKVEAAPAPVVAPVAAPAAESADNTAESSNNLLQLARRLHDEHVAEGAQRRDSLIAEGHATAARVVAEAEAKQRAQMQILEQERSVLEHKIDELRNFEREYRSQLRGYIEGQLKDLDASSSSSAPDAQAGVTADSAAV